METRRFASLLPTSRTSFMCCAAVNTKRKCSTGGQIYGARDPLLKPHQISCYLPTYLLTRCLTQRVRHNVVTLATKLKFVRAISRNLQSYISDSLPSKQLWTSKSAGGRFDRQSTTMEPSSPAVASVSVSAGEGKPKDEKIEKSYLSAAVESMSSWGGGPSRSSTPKPTSAPGEGSGLKNQHGGDRKHGHGLSTKRYPTDCPPLNARWFYAVDVGGTKSTPLVRRLNLCNRYLNVNRIC